ncbi:oligosaccharide flippase family protein [Halioxenophilus sp. WMMB6]|uniref:oligosaccharide flippase family protein n=1 Tax=Halioxenophilus sp. WMMB6 TaxID=3073815 RepID=UPI00295E7410|nr:oligosaccharide flippase family protein [Halioxenophilus sp. WMMB6]
MLSRLLKSNLVWLLLSIGGGQFIRLLGNLVLTRLLVPEMFGLMALVNSFIMGLAMFSDVGIRGSIINNSNSHKAEFYNTAWTLQIIRGGLLYFIVLIFAFPLSKFYDIEQLPALLAVAGSVALLHGLMPTKMFWQMKELNLRRLSMIEIGSQVLGMFFLIGLSWYFRSVWALVFGSLITVMIALLMNSTLIPGACNRLHWNKQYFHEIFRYGRWILLSSGSMFLILQGDRLVMGKYFSLELLGIYSIAINFSMLINDTGEKVASKYLFPHYRKIVERGPEAIHRIRGFRNKGMLLGTLGCLPLMLGGQWLVEFLYKDNYHDAGWMLQILTLSAIFRLLDTTLRPLFLANANSFDSMVYQIIKAVIYMGSMILLVDYLGIEGLILAIVLAPLLNLVVLHIMMKKYGFKWHFDDVPFILFVLAIAYLGWSFMGVNPLELMSKFSA